MPKLFLIFKCPNCSIPQYIKEGQKTRKCPQCNKIIQISKAWIRGKTDDIQEAVQIIQKLKLEDKKNISNIESAYDIEEKKHWK